MVETYNGMCKKTELMHKHFDKIKFWTIFEDHRKLETAIDKRVKLFMVEKVKKQI